MDAMRFFTRSRLSPNSAAATSRAGTLRPCAFALLALLCLGNGAYVLQAQEIQKACQSGFLGRPELTPACLYRVRDLAFDPGGSLWVLDTGRVLRYPGGVFTASMAANLEIAAVGERLTFDATGALWIAGSDQVFRVVPPFTPASKPQMVYQLPQSNRAVTFFRGILFDSSGNLWVAEADRILRFAPPFLAGMQPNTVLGQPSFTETRPVEPRQNRLTEVRSIRFDRSGNLYVADNAASRILVFRPPFSTFMNAAAVIGQNDFTSFRPGPFDQGGLAYVVDMSVDSSGALWVLHNETLVSVYRPPFSAGTQRDFWFDTITPRPENPPFPYRFNTIYERLVFGPDNDLWFSAGAGAPGFLARLEPPVVASDGVRNAAGYERTLLSPGLMVTLYGTQLGFRSGISAPVGAGPLPLALGKTQVKVNGAPVPLLYASDRQINFLAPYQLDPGTMARVQVVIDGFHGPPVTVPVATSSPGLFTLAGGSAAVLNHAYVVGPLQRGSFGIAFGTGLGQVSPKVETGAPAVTDPLSTVTVPVTVFLNGVGCRTLFAGLAPGFAGLYQVNFEVPSDLPRAPSYQIVLGQAGLASNAATAEVQ